MEHSCGFDDAMRQDFFVEYSRVSANRPSRRYEHYHDCFEIFYYLGEEMTYFINNQNFTLKKYDMALVNEYTFHRTKYPEETADERIVILFRLDVLNIISDKSLIETINGLFRAKGKVSFDENGRKEIHSIMLRIVANNEAANPTAVFISKLNLIELLITINNMAENGTLIEEVKKSNVLEGKVFEIINYINENYCYEITLDFLSNKFYVNKYYLCHIFKKITGLSIVEFINNKRLTEAERLLKSSNHNITEVCGMLGFNSMNYFIKLFKKKYSCTPNVMRKKSGE